MAEGNDSTIRCSTNRPNILVMTATITPPPGVISARSDPSVRLEDYGRALSFYLQPIGQGIDRIVFIEHSNVYPAIVRSLAHKADLTSCCEFISFNGIDYPPEYGYGFGEFKLLDYAMSTSTIIRAADCGAVITKVTGRYIV